MKSNISIYPPPPPFGTLRVCVAVFNNYLENVHNRWNLWLSCRNASKLFKKDSQYPVIPTDQSGQIRTSRKATWIFILKLWNLSVISSIAARFGNMIFQPIQVCLDEPQLINLVNFITTFPTVVIRHCCISILKTTSFPSKKNVHTTAIKNATVYKTINMETKTVPQPLNLSQNLPCIIKRRRRHTPSSASLECYPRIAAWPAVTRCRGWVEFRSFESCELSEQVISKSFSVWFRKMGKARLG